MADTEVPPISLQQFEAVMYGFGTAVQKLPLDNSGGRQRDAGAKLKYTGYVLLLQYEDDQKPGIVYTANPTVWHTEDPAAAKFQASQNLDIVNGVVSRKQDLFNILKPLLDHFGEATPLLRVLGFFQKLSPVLTALVPALAAVGVTVPDPVQLFDQWMNAKRAVPGKSTVPLIEAGIKALSGR